MSLNVVCTFVNILAAWNVEEVQIRLCKSQMQFYNYLIEKLNEKFLISVTGPTCYKRYSSTIKITKKRNATGEYMYIH